MKYFLNKALQEQDVIRRQSALNCAKSKVVKAKRFDSTRLFLTMLFGQITILFTLFVLLKPMFSEEDLLFLDKAPLIKQVFFGLATVSSKWYLEALVLIGFAFVVPCILGWIIALPVKLFPVKNELINPQASDCAKKIYDRACEIKTHVEEAVDDLASGVGALAAIVYAIIVGVVGIISVLMFIAEKRDFGNIVATLIGLVIFTWLVWVAMTVINNILLSLANTFTRNFKADKEALSNACAVLEEEWVSQDPEEQERRLRIRIEEEEEKRRLEEEKKRKAAEAAVWAYQNRYTSSVSESSTSTLTEKDHDELDALTEAMGCKIDVSDV